MSAWPKLAPVAFEIEPAREKPVVDHLRAARSYAVDASEWELVYLIDVALLAATEAKADQVTPVAQH